MAKKRRIFVAIKISKSLGREISLWQKEFLDNNDLRLISPENLHATLILPWYEENVHSIIESLQTLGASSFVIEFTKVSLGPDPRHPRLVWTFGEAPDDLHKLQLSLEELFPKYKSSHKDFLLHLTLARFNHKTANNKHKLQFDDEVLWQDKINSFVLMESHLSRTGANYEVLEEFPLSLP